MARNKLSAISVDSKIISGIESVSISQNISTEVLQGDALPHPTVQVISEIKPMLKATTNDIDGLLTAFGTDGFLGGKTVIMSWQNCSASGVTATTGVTGTCTTSSLALIQSIKAALNRHATADMEAYFSSTDGTTSPITWNAAGAIQTAVPATVAYTNGPIKLWVTDEATTLVAETSDISIDLGYKVEQWTHSGLPYCQGVDVSESDPKISCKTQIMSNITTIPPDGIACTGVVFLRAMGPTGGRVAEDEESHIGIVFTGVLYSSDHSGSGGGAAEMGIEILPANGASLITGIQTGIAITPAQA